MYSLSNILAGGAPEISSWIKSLELMITILNQGGEAVSCGVGV